MHAISDEQLAHVGDTAAPGAYSGPSPTSRLP